MYISNSAAFNMRIKVTIFTRPLKGSNETEVSFSSSLHNPGQNRLKRSRDHRNGPWVSAPDLYL